jgi:hypothetical protein
MNFAHANKTPIRGLAAEAAFFTKRRTMFFSPEQTQFRTMMAIVITIPSHEAAFSNLCRRREKRTRPVHGVKHRSQLPT